MREENGTFRRMTQAERDERRSRDYQFKMRMNERERVEIERRMKETGYENMNDYLIDMATQGYILIPQGKYIEPIKDCTYELNKIGVNVNQIAHRVNSTNVFNDYDFASLKVLLDEGFRILREAFRYFLV